MKKIMFLSFLMLFLTVSIVYGACTFNSPLDSGAINSDSYNLNLSCTMNNVTNCSINVGSTLTANTSADYLFYNTTTNTSFVNGTLNTSGLQDANNYVFGGTCWNETNTSEAITSVTGVTIDNTVPTAATTPSPADGTTDSDGDVDISMTVNGIKTTGCTLYFPNTNPGAAQYTMTHSGNTCTQSLTGMASAAYDWYVVTSDGTNTSTGTTYDLGIDTTTGGGGGGGARASPSLTIPDQEEIQEKVKSELDKKELLKTGIGVGTGALIGTFIVPGVGTVAGGVIGLILGVFI